MRPTDPPSRLPRFARRRPADKRAPCGGARPGWARLLLDVLHKLLTAGAALATILRVLF
ncbi:hypothetical protein [Falsiroseomonas sp.]|uniref:hypothetical protein n=1 Tax=Falsiroseomonas sp. TaxID=2870721 RepID=UPI00272020E2|nr:hypothetical protein [Falsiroseomonas sp.]MDO9503696.1 hypothetical protein [Falsiroseomonas sp.]MDP3416970.1 hypothetical protein [Falsiroseomonas sp.]